MKFNKQSLRGASRITQCVFGAIGKLLCCDSVLAQPFRELLDPPLYFPKGTFPKDTTSGNRDRNALPLSESKPTIITSVPSDASPQPGGIVRPQERRNEVSVSGDFMFGEGQVTLPIGYSLQKSLGRTGAQAPVNVASADRSSTYFGGTISYSYGQAWYLDLSYAQGSSSGTTPIDAGTLGHFNADFTIDDEWYQAYVRYAFPGLRGKRLSAYLRAGATLVEAELQATSKAPAANRYTQTDNTEDILGNLGFGVGYSLYSTPHVRIGLQAEGEAFYGFRTQESEEHLSPDNGVNFQKATIDNTLYGGIGRATIRFEYRFGQTGAFKAYAEGGAQVRYTIIEYPKRPGTVPEEILYGPYVKLGVRYAF